MFIIPKKEISRHIIRPHGSGDLRSNKLHSRVDLQWNILTSPSLDEASRALLLSRLDGIVNTSGILQVSSQKTRSPYRNLMLAQQKLQKLISWALRQDSTKPETAASMASNERRIASKHHHSQVKSARQAPPMED